MKRIVLFLPIALVLTCTVLSQTTVLSQALPAKAVLTGTVYDINHAVIAFGKVVARSFGGKEYQATTNTEGIYNIELPLDVYKIEANASGFCPKRVEMFRVSKSSLLVDRLSARTMPVLQRPLDFVLEVSPSAMPWLTGDQPCKQKTMIKNEPPKRPPEFSRSIAE